ncbi:TIGR04255 family protein [Cronbergia sp. UHCC 0137]|uniref:TIGR04255 family protein n=1 Tax=Cronbergia sp. UHCC 0137 TaxID=3110239 RepID=UPI002B2203CD|nr:TIGR04255 family protein [Cronbergia sp. UHCC 0137]MEA5618759.1 TIGR04255 family protein [Cronbergia sp. UHCC 0137]
MASVRFRQPPLDEIIFSVEFVASGFSSVHLGLYWESIRSEFPLQQDNIPIELENYENNTPLLPRVWFMSNDSKKIIQLQDNLFIFNWRYSQEDKNLHFGEIFQNFVSQWNHLQEWWLNVGDEPIEIQKYEFTYVNAINKNLGWQNPKDHGKIFNFIKTEWNGLIKTPDSFDFQLSFSLPNQLGSLSVKVEQLPVPSDDNEEEVNPEYFLAFLLIATSYNATISIVEWFTFAHDYVVKAFLELTKEDAQKLWGRYDY